MFIMVALRFFDTNLANCLIKMAGAFKLIFKCLSHFLREKFFILSFSNKEALLIKQFVPFIFKFAKRIILFSSEILFKLALIKKILEPFFSRIFFNFSASFFVCTFR